MCKIHVNDTRQVSETARVPVSDKAFGGQRFQDRPLFPPLSDSEFGDPSPRRGPGSHLERPSRPFPDPNRMFTSVPSQPPARELFRSTARGGSAKGPRGFTETRRLVAYGV